MDLERVLLVVLVEDIKDMQEHLTVVLGGAATTGGGG